LKNAKRSAFTIAQWVLAIGIVWFALRALRGQWNEAASRLASINPSWGWIGIATAFVFATYVLLIDTWRQIVLAAGERLPFRTAARIWFVSNLGKYVPGKIWSIAAMTMMARDNNVSAMAAAGSSILIQLVTIAAGIGVVLVAGAQAIDRPTLAVVTGVSMVLLLAAIPMLLPAAGRVASALTGKPISLPVIAPVTLWMTTARAVASWIAYGIAFRFFVIGLLGSATGATSSYVAVYASSYIIGFLALFAPGGAVVRESAMITGMLRLGLSGQADALAVAVASRLWLTVTELLPGLAYLALGKSKARTQ
jgi:uncharacterized membrane protein YbhN (UPF0104 family)